VETITVSQLVRAAPDQTFAWLSDASNLTSSRYVLRTRLSRPGTEAPYGLDAVRRLTWVFGWFEERITEYDPPHGYAYVVERSVPPLRHEGGRLRFVAVPGGTEVTWVTTVQMRLPAVGPLMTRHVGAPLIATTFAAVLRTADAALAG
jgi:hypothetical protein